jgi:cellulose synthase/poly-beta-1,6-N-acetylglucosamine synthase-like glycosyltransferase
MWNSGRYMILTEFSEAPASHILVWGALAVLCYAYFGYPLLLFLVGFVRRRPQFERSTSQPSVSVIVAAWNEASTIVDKIENTLGQSYPSEQLELIIVSDGSTDSTDEIAERYARRTGRVKALRTQGREGKSAALNLGVSTAAGDVIVMTDANAMFELDAVAQLVGHLGDTRVGAVSGELRYRSEGFSDTESAYWRYEQRVKALESRLGLLLGANGSIYAIRRDLFRPLRPLDVNDLRIPYEVLLQDRAVVLEPRAISYESPADALWSECRRKVRIMSRAIPTVISLIPRTLARGRLLVLWQLVSHKLLREIQGFWFAALFVGAVWGMLAGSRLLGLVLAGQLGLYALGALAWSTASIRSWRWARLAAHFDMIVLASMAALGLWLMRRVRPTWEPSRASDGGA